MVGYNVYEMMWLLSPKKYNRVKFNTGTVHLLMSKKKHIFVYFYFIDVPYLFIVCHTFTVVPHN